MVFQKCQWCGKKFQAYKSSNRKFCSLECHYRNSSKKYNPNGYVLRPDLTELNKNINPTRMTDEIKKKIRHSRLNSGNNKTYSKYYGRHTHRVVAEKMLGRALNPDEVVHHIDGNIRNNEPENLYVFPSKQEHSRYHAKLTAFFNRGGDAQ